MKCTVCCNLVQCNEAEAAVEHCTTLHCIAFLAALESQTLYGEHYYLYYQILEHQEKTQKRKAKRKCSSQSIRSKPKSAKAQKKPTDSYSDSDLHLQ